MSVLGLRSEKVSAKGKSVDRFESGFFAAFAPHGLSERASRIVSSELEIGFLRAEEKECLLSLRSLSWDEYGVLEKRLFVSSGGKKKECTLQ
ncbi:MAG: hypothetical protein ABSA77_03235 [Thermoguttaceae bacterium]